MVWLRLLGILGWLKNAALSAFDLARRYPLQAALIVAVVGLFWQNRAIHSARAERDTARHEVAAMIEASKANRAIAERQAHEQQAKLDQISKDAENDHKTIAKDADSRLAAYTKRMRIKNDCISAAPATAEGGNPGVPANVPSDTGMVAIRSDELQNLVDWFKVGLAAHNEAVAKVNSGAAMPDPAFGESPSQQP